ncbi:MAG TPA: indole-3-glycerol phosphate synthase TrpC [Clostridiales bacterium]|nr:indole-3-glycerol phosphate synthase TrpC [Clostridiales bacterium]
MILDTIAESTKARVAKAKEGLSLEGLKALLYENGTVRSFNSRTAFAFERAIGAHPGQMAFICEVKKASPSKGMIAEDFPYLEIGKEYEAAGATAISVLTEPEYFKGDDQYLKQISAEVHIPVLRKDFTVDEYQIYEAKAIGADAVLLICTLLDTETLKQYIRLCNELGLSALVEAHTEKEVYSAVAAGARIIGVNNRDLQTFEVDLNNSIRLRELVPKDILFIAESGIKTAQDIEQLRKAGVNGVLVGETLMRSPKKKELLRELRG